VFTVGNNTQPYQHQPFQWSLHFDPGSGKLKHTEFLAPNDQDPRRSFTESLVAALGKSDHPIIVYSHYEKTIMKEMALLFPDLAKSLHQQIERLRDLLPITKNHTYFRKYHGSFSIKTVGAVLTTAINYTELDLIADGSASSSGFAMISNGEVTDPAEVQAIRTALLEYCKLDTLAMVKVHEALMALT
jgi:hypothetical protein